MLCSSSCGCTSSHYGYLIGFDLASYTCYWRHMTANCYHGTSQGAPEGQTGQVVQGSTTATGGLRLKTKHVISVGFFIMRQANVCTDVGSLHVGT